MKIKYNNPFVALKHKNFRYYWFGMSISLIGTWMQNTAQPWLAYTLTNSPFLLSLIGMLQFTPMLLFSLFAGVIIDKFPKKRILIFTQSASLVITFILAMLVWTGNIRYWHILIMATALGFVNTLDMPTRQSFVIELVGKEYLLNAIALNSSVFNIARIIGPAVAGIIMGYAGIATCFFINSLSYAAVLISLIFIKPEFTQNLKNKSDNMVMTIKDGLKYIYDSEILYPSILMIAIVGTFAMNFNVLVPVFAEQVLNQQETGFGLLMSLMGIGSFLGAMFIATTNKSNSNNFTKFIMNAFPFIIGVLLIFTGLTKEYFLTGLCLALTGAFFVAFSSTANSIMQLNSTNEYRGRVMSVYSLVFVGSTPIGNLFTGIISEHFGANTGFIVCGTTVLLLLIPLFIYKNKMKNHIFPH